MSFRQGKYPFNFTLKRDYLYVLVRVGNHNFRFGYYRRPFFSRTYQPLPVQE